MSAILLSGHRETEVWDRRGKAGGLLGRRQLSSSAGELWTLALVSTL